MNRDYRQTVLCVKTLRLGSVFGGSLPCDGGDVMVKCSEPIVVAHSGLAAKQYVGTRGRPATVTDKTALVLGRWGVWRARGWGWGWGSELGGQGVQGEPGSCGGFGEGNEQPGRTLVQCDYY